MKADGTKRMKHGAGHAWLGSGTGSTPPQSRVKLLPDKYHLSFWTRFKEWWQ